MGKFSEYNQVTSLLASNIFLLDGPDGTKIMTADNLTKGLSGLLGNDTLFDTLDRIAPPELHRLIFRGKNLGTSFTAAQKAEVAAGTFKGLWLGDYWIINSVTWRIVDFDYWLNSGDTSFSKHHLVIMPDRILYSAKMNDTNTTEGGYVGSEMYTTNLVQAKTAFQNAFGSALLTHREYLVNAVTNGKPSGGAWMDSTVDLPNEVMMYGSHFFAPGCDGTSIPTLYTMCKSQLALMQACPKFINPARESQWLRDVVSAAFFAGVDNYGYTLYYYASASRGVRPAGAVG